MSQPETETAKWIRFANEDLRSAESLLSGGWVSYRNVCYLSQQAVEKAIKAAYVSINHVFEKSHSLDALKNQLPGEWKWKQRFPDISPMSVWAIESRYPGDWEEATKEDAQAALDFARKFLPVIEKEILSRLTTQ
jgi:HEPN domain-containing protein